MITKDTEEARNTWFAVEDINRRAEAAYHQHQDLFEDSDHQDRVAAVVRLTKGYLSGWGAIYETARAKTRNRPANTEVKFSRIVFNRKNKREDFIAQLTEMGIAHEQIIYKPNTESLSIHVV